MKRLLLPLLLASLGGCGVLKPSPVTEQEVAKRVAADKRLLQESIPQPVPSQALSLGDAVVQALNNNLDIRLAQLDAAIQRGVVNLADLQMLPRIVWDAGYTWRTPPGGSLSDTTPPEASRLTRQTEISWNILDFGISYVRARQEGNNLLIAEERRRRTANLMINDVRQAYWQSLLGQRRLREIAAVAGEIEAATLQSRKMIDANLQDPLVGLTYQEGLLELRRQMKAYEGEVVQAQARLSRLLNLPPGRPLALAEDDGAEEAIRELQAMDAGMLEDLALSTRSELREQDYQKRNRRLDIWAAYSQMLPSLIPRAALKFDSDNSLRANHWREEGGTATWNVLGILSAIERAGNVERSIQSTDLRRLALSLSVMEQTVTAYGQLKLTDEEYRLAHDITETRRKIWEVRRLRIPFGETDELERIRAAVAYVTAQINEDRIYTRLQKTYGDLLASVGIDQIPAEVDLGGAGAGEAIRQHLVRLPQAVRQLAGNLATEAAGPAPSGETSAETSHASPAPAGS